jgi:hypothetical protein
MKLVPNRNVAVVAGEAVEVAVGIVNRNGNTVSSNTTKRIQNKKQYSRQDNPRLMTLP